jgi:hypothetical protein
VSLHFVVPQPAHAKTKNAAKIRIRIWGNSLYLLPIAVLLSARTVRETGRDYSECRVRPKQVISNCLAEERVDISTK